MSGMASVQVWPALNIGLHRGQAGGDWSVAAGTSDALAQLIRDRMVGQILYLAINVSAILLAIELASSNDLVAALVALSAGLYNLAVRSLDGRLNARSSRRSQPENI